VIFLIGNTTSIDHPACRNASCAVVEYSLYPQSRCYRQHDGTMVDFDGASPLWENPGWRWRHSGGWCIHRGCTPPSMRNMLAYVWWEHEFWIVLYGTYYFSHPLQRTGNFPSKHLNASCVFILKDALRKIITWGHQCLWTRPMKDK
jgi:hypothetical protein